MGGGLLHRPRLAGLASEESILELAGENGERAWCSHAQTPAASKPPPLPQARLRLEAKFPRCPVRWGGSRAGGQIGRLGAAGLGIPPPRGAGGQ